VDQTGHTIYDPTKSPTAQNLDGTFNVTYGDGSFVSGPVALDTVDIGGSTVDAQAIGLPDTVARSFVTGSAADGLVGLAFSKLNTIKPNAQKTFFDSVMPDLTQPVFTAQLKHGQTGAYEFGIIDTSAFTGSLSTAAVDSSRGFWQVDSTTAAVNGQTIDIPGGSTILDTGTSLMLVTDDLLVGYWNQVNGAQLSQEAGGVIFPCNTQLPDLQVAIGNSYMATVPGSDMNFSGVGSDSTGTNCEYPTLFHPVHTC
jgi:Eukaryotic aspartyl protease